MEDLDEKIIKEKGNTKCIFYSDNICRKGDKTRDCVNCARVEYHSLFSLNWDNQERLEKIIEQKEQECDELKKTVMYKCPQCGEEYLSPIGASLYEENNNLKEEKAKYYQQTLDVEIQINELLQTLAEIKEIAEENIRIADLEGLNGVYRRGLAKQILQKISEVVE